MTIMTPEQMKQDHKVLAEFRYEPPQVEQGYAGQTLYVNVSDNTIAARPVDDKMKRTFVGGRGFGLWLLWNGVEDDTQWDERPQTGLSLLTRSVMRTWPPRLQVTASPR